MGLLNGLIKAGIAQKVINEARKPHNQAKIRAAVQKVAAQRRGGGGTSRGPRY